MTMRTRSFVAAALLAAAQLQAARIAVHAAPSPTAQPCLANATLVVHPLAGGEDVRIRACESTSIELPDGDSASLRIEGPHCWSEEVVVTAPRLAPAVIPTFAAAHVRGTLLPDGKSSAQRIEGSVFRTPNAVAPSRLSADDEGHRLTCSVSDGTWDCVVPAGTPFDLRLRPEGFAPLFFWNVAASAEKPETLPPATLHAGGSVAGWVEDPKRKPIAGARIVLAPAAAPEGESTRTPVRQYTARTNARGFFQLTGVDAGEYRLISRVDGLSPAVLPIVNVREREALVWPRPIVQQPLATLDVTLTPPTQPDGKPWRVSIREKQPLDTRSPDPVPRPANPDGTWRATKLRADVHWLTVSDVNGSSVESQSVDLADGTNHVVAIQIRRFPVRGVVRAGDEPLAATLSFSNSTGRVIKTSSDRDGAYEVAFPMPGKWKPRVELAGSRARMEPKAIDVPDAPNETSHIDIALGGGRMRGVVVGPDGTPEKAAIHVLGSAPHGGTGSFTQQITDDDGHFDFLGFDQGDYTIDASGKSGFARPLARTLARNETLELRIQLERAAKLRGIVLTPGGTPASGALVRLWFAGEAFGSSEVTDAEGRFEVEKPPHTEADVIVLTHAYPASIAHVSTDDPEPRTLRLQTAGAMIKGDHARIWLRRGTLFMADQQFWVPDTPLGLYDGWTYVEPGSYQVCMDPRAGTKCRDVTLRPFDKLLIDPAKEDQAQK